MLRPDMQTVSSLPYIGLPSGACADMHGAVKRLE